MPAQRKGPRIETVGELLHWSYANLAAAHAAERRSLAMPDQTCWMIRARLYKGLRNGTMNLGTLFADVREMVRDRCVYCGTVPPPRLHADHLIPRHRGGPESGDNLVWACQTCNSRKNANDLLEWYASQDGFPPLLLMRRYLKLAIGEAHAGALMDTRLDESPVVTFSLGFIPTRYPTTTDPVSLEMWSARDGQA